MLARGFSLLELMVAMAIAAILMMLAQPSFRQMVDNTKSKGAAESLLSGMRLARSEAIKRNAPMRFQLVSTFDNTCHHLATSSLWVISQTDQLSYGLVEGKCDQAAALPSDPCDASCNGNPYIAYKSDGTSTVESSFTVLADGAVVTFGPLGQITTNFDGAATLSQVTVTPANTAAKTWRVMVAAPSGSLKLCDTAVAAGQPYSCA